MLRPTSSSFRRSFACWLTVVLLASFAVTGPAEAQYRGFGKNKVRYGEFEWKIYHSPHFDVYYYLDEEPLLQKVVSIAESAYDQLSRELDFQIQEPTPLIFYATHSAFEQNNVILNFIPEGVGAFASPARNRMVMPVDMSDSEVMKLMLHELTHIFQYHILFGGSLSKSAASRPPTWVMEGMASYMAKDEEAHDKMVLRDAVVNDIIPPISQVNVEGYYAYRIGHAVFDYIEDRWGKEGFRDFIYEFRNTLGARTNRAIERAFRIDPEDFDVDFRRWLRRKYLQQLVETGEPSDFGRPFRVEDHPETQEISAAASPSGDLVAAVSYQNNDLDVVLFDAKKRRQIRNLSSGYSTEYQYLVVQGLTVARRVGRDLAFSPDGNYLAMFARRNEGRLLILFDVLNGGIARKISMDVEQQFSLAWSPDGRSIAFSGNRNGQFDLYSVDLDTEQITQLTNDPLFDGAPTYSADGTSIAFSSTIGERSKLFRIDLSDPTRRYALTTGESQDKDPVYSPDGKRLYFTSDRDGYDNIFALDLATGEITQHTDVVTGAFQPYPLARAEGGESLVYGGLWRGDYKLYLSDLEEKVGEPEASVLAAEPVAALELPAFQPPVEVSIDDANKDDYRGFKLFLADAQTSVGVDSNQTFLGQIYLNFSDYLGDHQIFAVLSSYDALSNFDITYADLSRRTQWFVNLADDREFFFISDAGTGQVLDRRQVYRVTRASAGVQRPFGFSSRVEAGLGYAYRKFNFESAVFDPETGEGRIVRDSISDDYPFVFAAYVRDTSVTAPWGPVSGSRFRVDGLYSADLENSGPLTTEVSFDARKYFPVTQRSNFALRLFAGVRDGNRPTPFYVGGENLRTLRFRGISGDRAAFTNAEFRFPIIDVLATPILRFQGIRGRVFLDVGAIYYDDLGRLLPEGGSELGDFEFWNSDENRLEDGIAAYGVGFTIRFLGLDLNWDIGKRWDFKDTLGDWETTFYIARSF